MNQQTRPAANAFPAAARASAVPTRMPMPARAVPARAAAASQPLRPGRPAVPAQPQPGNRPQSPQRPQAAPLPQPAPRGRAAQRPQVAPPLRPLQPPQPAPRPQAAPRPPTAQPPTPPRPYAPAPAAPRPPAPRAPAEPVGPPPRPHKSKVGRWIALLVIAGGVGGAVWFGTHAAPTKEGVGDCLAQTGGNQLTKVGCSDKSARFHVLGKLENKTVIDATLDACKAFPTATSAYWQGDSGQPGLVLCLEPVVPAAPAKK